MINKKMLLPLLKKIMIVSVILAAVIGTIYAANIIKHQYFPKITIYAVYHKKYPVFKSDAVVPIQAGRVLKRKFGLTLEDKMIGDDTGDNISDKNERYAELTAMYWAWKNDHDSDYIGIMHYRRHFKLPTTDETCDKSNLMCQFGLTLKSLRKLFPKYDIIIPNVNRQAGMTVYKQFIDNHYKEDMDISLDYIIKKYPEMKSAVYNGLVKTNRGYFNNLFIMRRDIFNEYATWLFDILFTLEDQHDPKLARYKTLGYYGTTKDNYQIRVEAFLAERLFTVWLYHNRNRFKVLEVPKSILPQQEEYYERYIKQYKK